MDPLERVLRDDWGRLLALLVAWCRRIDLAEDALADAFESAARTWPTDGVPDQPSAWLMTAARRRVTDRLRSEAVLVRRMPLLRVEEDVRAGAQRVVLAPSPDEVVVDERLRLVLLCTQPRLSREAAAAVTLRLVLGVSTEDLARLFLVSTPTMAARLTRARKRLAGGEFVIPAPSELSGRLTSVADVAYLAFTSGYAPGSGPDLLRPELAAEAIRLVRVVRSVAPPSSPSAELDALLALMLLHHARRDARIESGQLVLLADQDRSRWYHDEIGEAIELLRPFTDAPPAPYLLQALIAVEHAIAPTFAATSWTRIVARHDELLALQDSPVVRLNRAIALAERDGPAAGLDALDGVALSGHRLPAVRAELLARLGRHDEARDAYSTALALCRNDAESKHLAQRRAALEAR